MLAKIVFILAVIAAVSSRPQLYSGYGYGDNIGYSSGYPGYYGYSGYSGYSPLSYGGYNGYSSYPGNAYNAYGTGYGYY